MKDRKRPSTLFIAALLILICVCAGLLTGVGLHKPPIWKELLADFLGDRIPAKAGAVKTNASPEIIDVEFIQNQPDVKSPGVVSPRNVAPER